MNRRLLAPLGLALGSLFGAAGTLAQPAARGLAAPGPAGSAPRSALAAPSAASALARPRPTPAATGFAPDPPPLTTRRKWLYEIYYQEGAFFVPTPTLVERPKPTGSPRTMGRFALELYVGRALLERVRFDVPMLSGEPPPSKNALLAPPDLERRARARVVIELPDSDRATYALLIDRATGHHQRVFWVPTDGPQPALAPAALPASAAPASAAPASSTAP